MVPVLADVTTLLAVLGAVHNPGEKSDLALVHSGDSHMALVLSVGSFRTSAFRGPVLNGCLTGA